MYSNNISCIEIKVSPKSSLKQELIIFKVIHLLRKLVATISVIFGVIEIYIYYQKYMIVF